MEDVTIESLIAQDRVVTTTDLSNPANDYMIVGVYQNGTNKMKGNGTSYKNYVISIAELLGGGSAYTASNGVVLIGNDFQLASQNISQFINDSGYLTAATVKASAWAPDGNGFASEKFLGTLNNFALPFRVNNNEVMRITTDAAGSTRLYINQTTNLHGSNSGIQYSSDGTSPNRSQIRFNLYGANTGAPGITGFKSRGATIGSTLSVLPGDNLFRITSIGVSGNNSSINLASLIDVRVNQVFAGHVSTDFVVALNSNAGVMTERLYVTSEGDVGIGTSLPVQKLDVLGNINVGLSNGYYLNNLKFLSGNGLNSDSIQLGRGANGTSAPGDQYIAMGIFSYSTESGIAIGYSSTINNGTFDGVAIGRGTTVDSGVIRGVALGRNANAKHNNAWAIGYNSITTQDDEFNFGVVGTDSKLIVNGRVGIGTSTPAARLHVKSISGGNSVKWEDNAGNNLLSVTNNSIFEFGWNTAINTPSYKFNLYPQAGSDMILKGIGQTNGLELQDIASTLMYRIRTTAFGGARIEGGSYIDTFINGGTASVYTRLIDGAFGLGSGFTINTSQAFGAFTVSGLGASSSTYTIWAQSVAATPTLVVRDDGFVGIAGYTSPFAANEYLRVPGYSRFNSGTSIGSAPQIPNSYSLESGGSLYWADGNQIDAGGIGLRFRGVTDRFQFSNQALNYDMAVILPNSSIWTPDTATAVTPTTEYDMIIKSSYWNGAIATQNYANIKNIATDTAGNYKLSLWTGGSEKMNIRNNGWINMSALPTSGTGFPPGGTVAGDLWIDTIDNSIKIV